MDSYDVLVIILSVMLAIFLALGITLLVLFIKVASQLKKITTKAEEIVDDVEAVSGFFKKTAGPVAITSLISNIVAKVTEYSKRKDSK